MGGGNQANRAEWAGLTPAQAAEEIQKTKAMFDLLPYTAANYPAWEALVIQHGVSGKPSHDARLVAAMQGHGLSSVLTFDQSGFSRFPGIEVVHPATVRPIEPETQEATLAEAAEGEASEATPVSDSPAE